jgi:hypothetical protein
MNALKTVMRLHPLNSSSIGGIRIPDFKICYKATVTKTVWYCHANQPVEENKEPRN